MDKITHIRVQYTVIYTLYSTVLRTVHYALYCIVYRNTPKHVCTERVYVNTVRRLRTEHQWFSITELCYS